MFKRVCVVGLGYIGLPTAAVASSVGYEVVGLDVNKEVVDTINRGDIHIVEPGLEAIIRDSVRSGRLKATLEAERADIFVIAVPTPFKGKDHKPDLSYIKTAVDMISPVLEDGNLVILESTSPVGTSEKLVHWISTNRPDIEISDSNDKAAGVLVAYCPERVLPGSVIRELRENDRIIGGICAEAGEAAERFYSAFVTGRCHKTNAKTAELSKLVENSYRDVNIAFANEVSAICDDQAIDVWELIELANRHPRVNVLSPGAGVGGHCIAVDPWFIISQNPDNSKLIKQARLINDEKPFLIVEDVVNFCKTNLSHDNPIRIALFGLSYKPDIDDLRESPAVIIAKALAEKYPGQVFVVEPHISEDHELLQDGLKLISPEEALHICDLAVLLVPHTSFREIFVQQKTGTTIFDYCGVTKA